MGQQPDQPITSRLGARTRGCGSSASVKSVLPRKCAFVDYCNHRSSVSTFTTSNHPMRWPALLMWRACVPALRMKVGVAGRFDRHQSRSATLCLLRQMSALTLLSERGEDHAAFVRRIYRNAAYILAALLGIFFFEAALRISLENYWFTELGQSHRYWLS